MHITIAGNLGSGKSTVCEILNNKYGFDIYSTGKIQRSIAEKMNLTTLEMNRLMSTDKKYDHLIDDEVAKISEEKIDTPIVFDSRMAWLFAKNSFKVYLIIDPIVAAKRVIDTRKSNVESYNSIDDAVNQLAERTQVENERFKNIYNVDNLKYTNYDLIVDTSFLLPEQIADIIYNGYRNYIDNKSDSTLAFISPKSLYPTKTADNNENILIANYMGYNYVLNGHSALFEALDKNSDYVCAEINEENPDISKDIDSIGLSGLKDLEEKYNFKYNSYPESYK